VLLIAAFAVYVIITKRLRITRSTTVTGDKARTFGVALLVLTIPFSLLISALLRVVLPSEARAWPVPQVLYGVLFSGAALWMAYYFRDCSSASPALSVRADIASSGDQPLDSNLLGEWHQIAPGTGVEGIFLRFEQGGRLIYTIEGDTTQHILLTSEVVGDTIVSDQPSKPRLESTKFHFESPSRLVLERPDGQYTYERLA